jgi:hypothetical protein
MGAHGQAVNRPWAASKLIPKRSARLGTGQAMGHVKDPRRGRKSPAQEYMERAGMSPPAIPAENVLHN